DVAVESVGLDVPVVGVAGQHQVVAVAVVPLQVEEVGGVLGVVRVGVDAVVVPAQEALGHHAVTVEVGVGEAVGQLEVGGLARPAELAEEVLRVGVGMIAPAVFLEVGAGHEPVPVPGATAVFGFLDLAAVGADGALQGAAGVVATVLGLHGEGAAEGVEAEYRVAAGGQRDAGNGVGGNQIPAHHIAE